VEEVNELDRYAVSLENIEVLRAQVEELEAWKAEEFALMNPLMDYARSVCTGPLGCSITEWLVEDHRAQVREIERLDMACRAHEKHRESVTSSSLNLDTATQSYIESLENELAALNAQPSGVVLPERKQESPSWGYDMGGNYDEGHADGFNACLDEVASLNQPASALDENSEEGLEEWAKGKFGIGGRYTGKLYGNTDWALARVVWSAALSRAALSANHSELVLPERKTWNQVTGREGFIKTEAHNACLDEVARLNQPASAGWVDERAAFEAAVRRHHQGDMRHLESRTDEGYYVHHIQELWLIWQARAALSAPSHGVPEGKEFSQFLSAVMDAAGLVRHGRQSKELSEYLGKKCMEYRGAAPSAGSQKEQG
jgi:hypothetical protein